MSQNKKYITIANAVQSAITLLGFIAAYKYGNINQDLTKFIISFTAATATSNQLRNLLPSIYYQKHGIFTTHTLIHIIKLSISATALNLAVQTTLLEILKVEHSLNSPHWITLFALMSLNYSILHLFIQTSNTMQALRNSVIAAIVSICYLLYVLIGAEITLQTVINYFLINYTIMLTLNLFTFIYCIKIAKEDEFIIISNANIIKIFAWDSITRYIPILEKSAAANLSPEFLLIIDSAQRFLIRPATLVYSGYVAIETRDAIARFKDSHNIQNLFKKSNTVFANFLKITIVINLVAAVYAFMKSQPEFVVVTIIYSISQAIMYWNDVTRKALTSTRQIHRVMLFNAIQALMQITMLFLITHFRLTEWLIPTALFLAVSINFIFIKNMTRMEF